MDFKKYFQELKRRKVFKAAVAYVAVAWVLIQVASAVLPAFDAPPFLLKALIILLALGFPVNLVFSWVYDVTPEGLKKTDELPDSTAPSQFKGRRLNRVIIGFLSLAVIILLYNQFGRSQTNNAESASTKATADSTIKSIAVMPFKDNSPAADHEWLASALVDVINNSLKNINGLRVIARPSVAYLESTNSTPVSIAENLELTHYLEGSVIRIGNRIRIIVTLISSDDFSQLWSKNFDEDMASINEIIDEVASSVGRELNYEFNLSEISVPATERTSSTEAWDLYQKAKYEGSKVIGAEPTIVRDYLEQAIKLDSLFFAAYDALGYHISSQYTWDGDLKDDFEKDIEKANSLYEFVIQKEPSYGMPYIHLAINKIWYEQDLEAYALYLKGVELTPAKRGSGNLFLPALGDNPEKHYQWAMAGMRESPYEPSSWTAKGLAEYFTGRHDAAIKTFEEAMNKFTNGVIQGTAVRVFYALGKYQKVINSGESYFTQVPNSRPARILGYLAAAHYKLGNQQVYESLMEELKEQAATSPIGSPAFHLAMVNAQTGDHESTFQWLDKAIEDKEVELFWLKVEPPFQPLYKDPRWEELMEEMGFNDIPKIF
ncbi:hypothetical protein [uncultured Eudoraea sp.]|uniref:hypothetical protein n=1 Tax=uncultured Eudoraea sp. TaxID=1035614 RepID=UPI00261CE7D6|nr:hypothetical protein [uncultured Eudoraea sp.]